MKTKLLWPFMALIFMVALRAQLPLVTAFFSKSSKASLNTGASSEKTMAKTAELPTTAGVIRYVSNPGAGTNDGSSWADASSSIQAMIDASAVGDQVWVAEGVYYTASQSSKFSLKSGVEVYGGFAGTESNLDQRVKDANETILSGDLNGDDVVSGQGATLSITGQDDNASIIVEANSCSVSTTLDGFSIKGGNGLANSGGAGLKSTRSSLKIANCIFYGNAGNKGAAIYADTNSVVSVVDCEIISCKAGVDGGIYCKGIDSLKISNTNFERNAAGSSGGGIYIEGDFPVTISNCNFTDNSAFNPYVGRGGVIMVNATGLEYYGKPTSNPIIIDKCEFVNNSASSEGGSICTNGDFPVTISNCNFTNNNAGLRGGAILLNIGEIKLNSQNSVTIDKCNFRSNSVTGSFGTGGAILVFQTNQLTLTNSVFEGNSASAGAAVSISVCINNGDRFVGNCIFTNNNGQNAVQCTSSNGFNFFNCTFSSNQGDGFWGGSSSQSEFVRFVNCIFGSRLNVAFGAASMAACVLPDGLPSNVTDLGGSIFENPLFVDASNPIGLDSVWGTEDDGLRLKAASPAIDAGISGYDNVVAPTVDFMGISRPQGAAYDIGAYEQAGQVVQTPCTAVLSSLNVTLDGNGQFSLPPQTVAAGPCAYANYRVVVQDNNQSNGGTIDCAGTWTYGLFDADGHLVAWGKVTAEDKTAPALIDTDFYTGTLDCYDVNYVLNNPMTIGNVLDGQTNLTNSPKPAATSTQTILYAEGPTAPANTTDDKIKNLGYPNFQDNCRDCGCRVTLKWSDKVVYYSCADMATNGNIYAKIFREWVATDCNGMRSSVVQVIPFARPAAVLADPCAAKPAVTKQLVFRGTNGKCGADANVAAPGYDWVVQYTSCTPDKSLIQKADVMPSFRSFFYNSTTKRDIYLDEAECNYSVQIKDTEFPTCGGKGLKIDREIYVFDWCAGGVIDTLHVLIKITDDQAPTLTAPAFVNGAPYTNPDQFPTVEISTGPMDCTASFPITVAGIKKTFGYTIADNCSLGNVTMSVKTRDRYVKGILVAQNTWDKVDYAIMNNSMIGLPTGEHRLIIDMSDGCYNASRDSFYFFVTDKIAPVMKCDDQLNVSLSNGNGYTTGYAQVTVEDLNEGSWDNCKLEWVKARRNVPAAAVASFIAKGYDSNNNGKLDAAVGNDINADGDYNDTVNGVDEVLKAGADGIDINGDGDFADFGETFVLKGGKLMTPLTDAVEFFCGDVAAKVVVELWGQDTNENRSFCWEEILIEDKVAPACVAPFDLTIDCTEKCLEKIDDQAVSAACFGDVTITSGNDCADLDTVYTVKKNLKCGYGFITRSWALTKQTAKGPITINCAQTITVLPRHNYNITFPKDAIANCKQPIVDTVIVDELSCDILSVNVLDKRYDASNDECYKIFRTYTVINWCTFADECGDATDLGDGSSDHVGAYVIDRGTFDNYGKEALNFLVRDDNREAEYGPEYWISKDLEPSSDDVHDTFYDDMTDYGDCDPDQAAGLYDLESGYSYLHAFQYTQIIKVYDDERPIVTGDAAKFCIRDGADCLANLKMVINGKDNCSDKVTLETNVLMIAPYQTLDASKMIMYSSPKWSTVDKGNGDFEINVKDLAPLGTHDLIVVVRDECGNLSVPTRIPFTIADCKGPAPICINGLSTDLMSDGNGAGMMAVWASDFVASKIYDCNGQGPEVKDGLKLVTKYSLNRVGDKKDKNVTGINLTCADKGKVILVELHAWDEAGNDDFCVTYVELQDNRNVCPGSTTGGSFNIAGTISTEGTANLQGAAITLSGQTSMSATTTANGAYSFVNLAKGGDFTIAPQLDKNHLNGVSTFDLVLIQKHILGVVALNSPYKMIAADVNNSKSITTLDLIALRKLILNVDQSFHNNTSWRFVDASYKFPNVSNPWAAAFPEVVSVNDLAANTTANFVAIKVGDVNASATVSSATAAEVRTNGTLEINAAEAALKAGQEYSVEFNAADLKNVQGYQFALNLDKRKVELVDIVYGVAKAENFGVFASEGIITTSWNSEAKQGALFTLVLRAKADAQLSKALSLNRIVAAEAYNGNNDQLDVALKFNGAAVNNGFELKQNTPNPFNGETVINFNLPKATVATLTISDVTGRILKSVRATYAKGMNQVTLKASDLKASGVLYYTLEADDFTATKKMILVRE